MNGWGVRVFALAFFFASFGAGAIAARATIEYCPAHIRAAHAFAPDASGSVYALVLSAESERTVDAQIIATAGTGFYSAQVTALPIHLDAARYQTAANQFTVNEYYSDVVFVRFPKGNVVDAMWIGNASSANDTRFGWGDRGTVSCLRKAGPFIVAEDAFRHRPNAPAPYFQRLTAAPFDIARPPGSGDRIINAVPTTAPGSTYCAKPFAEATVISIPRPQFPVSTVADFSEDVPLTVLVAVAVSKDGAPDDAWVVQPSGSRTLDDAAIKEAKRSEYKAGRSFCEVDSRTYIFHLDFNPN